MRRKTCEYGERGFLEPRSPVVQSKANRRAHDSVPALTRFDRMEVRTLRCEGRRAMNLMKETNGHLNSLNILCLRNLGFPTEREFLGNGVTVVV
jgi:hypothetical protein